MNLWVRSQDKECLINVNNIQYVYKNYMHGLGTYYDNLKILGTYKTKERALEVLDVIQKLLKPKIMMKYNDDCTMSVSEIELQPSTYVYEMPKD